MKIFSPRLTTPPRFLPYSTVIPLKLKAPPIGKAPVHVESFRLRCDVLEITVAHLGGAKQHAYQATWTAGFGDRHPMDVYFDLSHHSRGDAGRKRVTTVLSIDLQPLKDQLWKQRRENTGTVHLGFTGSNVGLTYQF
jgi:hypothetical protein